ncbi:MAG: hypothetical protein IJW67_13075 [Blautia sp.]|nr:hypothetical protein [Blautia sp.]
MAKRGSITVFFTLMLSLILSLLCTSIESVRMASARTQILNGMDIGLYSLFGEYDKELLTDYDLFLLDGSCGGGALKLSVIYKELEAYMKPVLKQNGQKLSIQQGGLTGYRLVTDEKGEVFYQQVIQYMKETLGSHGVQLLMNHIAEQKKQTDKAEKDGKALENKNALSSYDSEVNRATRESQQALDEARKRAEEESELTGREIVVITPTPPRVKNPIRSVKRTMRKNILNLVIPGKNISKQKVKKAGLASVRKLQNGMQMGAELKKDNSYASGILFQQYLMEKLGNYSRPVKNSGLQYQIEYILKGKTSDKENLKAVAKELLLIREGVNIAALLSDSGKMAAVESLAAAISAAFLIPPAVGVIEAALILCWTFAESILDERELFAGGRVPLIKKAGDWQISLENLMDLVPQMDRLRKNDPNGLSYEDYLQIMLLKESKTKKLQRGMDMVECSVRSHAGRAAFRLDSCITGLEASIDVKANRRKIYTVTRAYDYK